MKHVLLTCYSVRPHLKFVGHNLNNPVVCRTNQQWLKKEHFYLVGHFGKKLFLHSSQCTAASCTDWFWPNLFHVTKLAFNLSTVLQQYHEDGARIEAAFRRYIHRADPKQKEDSYEIIVCHANVIRYFVCRFVSSAGQSVGSCFANCCVNSAS